MNCAGSGLIYCGDCLEVLPTLPDNSVDMCLTDPPYETTSCKWDKVIPFEPMWKELKRVVKPNGAIVMTASQPFTSALVMSNPTMFKWEDIWHKSHATGHLNAWVMPMREHENIVIFGKKRITYNPQITPKAIENVRPESKSAGSECYGKFKEFSARTIPPGMSFPRSVVKINTANTGEAGLHPTQKPVALFEYLIKTYSNEGDTVLDFACGSGTTGAACVNTGRNFILIEKEPKYCEIAKQRIDAIDPMFRTPVEIVEVSR